MLVELLSEAIIAFREFALSHLDLRQHRGGCRGGRGGGRGHQGGGGRGGGVRGGWRGGLGRRRGRLGGGRGRGACAFRHPGPQRLLGR
ncbi:MAG: hypothetical protein FJ381_03390 [Verrucomicrobia bacterium]|nr:hypothetical protein [Verrucomicrobiota bacterium]